MIGRAYLAEAKRLFGPGVGPVQEASAAEEPVTGPIVPLVLGVVVGGSIGLSSAIIATRRRRALAGLDM